MTMNPTLPNGWHSEEVRCGQTLLKMPSGIDGPGGYVTIDWDRRGFRSGYSTSGRLTSTEKYAGRGWKEKLVADAVAWLQGVYTSRSDRSRS